MCVYVCGCVFDVCVYEPRRLISIKIDDDYDDTISILYTSV